MLPEHMNNFWVYCNRIHTVFLLIFETPPRNDYVTANDSAYTLKKLLREIIGGTEEHETQLKIRDQTRDHTCDKNSTVAIQVNLD